MYPIFQLLTWHRRSFCFFFLKRLYTDVSDHLSDFNSAHHFITLSVVQYLPYPYLLLTL